MFAYELDTLSHFFIISFASLSSLPSVLQSTPTIHQTQSLLKVVFSWINTNNVKDIINKAQLYTKYKIPLVFEIINFAVLSTIFQPKFIWFFFFYFMAVYYCHYHFIDIIIDIIDIHNCH